MEALPGGRLDFVCPVSPLDKLEIHKEGNLPVEFARAAIVFPTNFHFGSNWNLLIVSATTDGKASSIYTMRAFTNTASKQNWVVLAADGPQGKPRLDYPIWRFTMIKSALNQLHKTWPVSTNWNLALGGFSGGAKWSGLMAPALFKSFPKITGVFMGGCNEDRVSDGCRIFHPAQKFLETKIFLSGGLQDRVATPSDHERVGGNIKKTGFGQLRLKMYDGGHQLWKPHLEEAMGWFAGNTNHPINTISKD